MRTPRAVAIVMLVGLAGTACGARLPENVHTAAKNAILSTNSGGGTGTGTQTGSGDPTQTGSGSNVPNPTNTSGGGSQTTTGGTKGTKGTKGTTGGSGNSQPTGNQSSSPTNTSNSGGSKCPPSATDTGLTSNSMTLGTVADRTGPVAGLFAGAQQGAVAFAGYENNNGGLCGHSVNIKFADSGTNCSQNKNDTSGLVNQVFAFVGSFSLYDGQGCGYDVLKANPKVPDIHVALDPTAETLPNHYDLEPGALGYATGMWKYYAQKFGSKVQHVGTIAENIPSALAKQKAEVHSAESQGWKFTYSNDPSATTFDFTSQFQQMCGKEHIQVFFTVTENAQNAATMMKNEQSVAACKGVINIIPIAYDSAFLPDFQGSASGLQVYGWNEYSMFFNSYDASKIPEVALFQQWFKRTNGNQPINLYAMFAWADGRMLQDAFENAKTGNRAGVMTALKALKNWSDDGLVAPNTPSSKTTGNKCYILWQLNGGNFSRLSDPAITKSNPGGYRCDGTWLKSN